MIGRNDLARHVDKDRQKAFAEKVTFLDPKSMRRYKEAIAKFLDAEKKGATKEEAFHESGRFADPGSETGIFRNPAGKPVYELSDEFMKVDPSVSRFFDPQKGGQTPTAPLGHMVDHPELFSRLPILGKTPTRMIMPEVSTDVWGGEGSYTPRGYTKPGSGRTYPEGEIMVKARNNVRDPNADDGFSLRDTTLHEGQHDVNNLQNSFGGDSPDHNEMQNQFSRQVHPRAGFYSEQLGRMKQRLMDEVGLTEEDWLQQFAEPDQYLKAANSLFVPGRNTRTAKTPFGKSALPYMQRYESTAGESQARLTASRKNLSAQDRRDGPDYPWLPGPDHLPYELQMMRHGTDSYSMPDDRDTLIRLVQGRAPLSSSGAPANAGFMQDIIDTIKRGLKF